MYRVFIHGPPRRHTGSGNVFERGSVLKVAVLPRISIDCSVCSRCTPVFCRETTKRNSNDTVKTYRCNDIQNTYVHLSVCVCIRLMRARDELFRGRIIAAFCPSGWPRRDVNGAKLVPQNEMRIDGEGGGRGVGGGGAWEGKQNKNDNVIVYNVHRARPCVPWILNGERPRFPRRGTRCRWPLVIITTTEDNDNNNRRNNAVSELPDIGSLPSILF